VNISISKMSDVAVGHKVRIRQLSLGPISWGAWSWTFSDGSTWAALGFDGDTMIGWAILTMEIDVLPVIGAFTDERHRGQGIGATLASALLRSLVESGELYPGAAVFASTERWKRWHEVVESAGLRCLTWE
jgi:GNAT superfamily N-acetyltransferase